jgi:hypothetical protein
MRFYKRIGYHDFEGVANDLDEREAHIVRDLGEHKCLILKHHGLLTAGVNVGEAFNLHVLSGEELRDPDDGARLELSPTASPRKPPARSPRRSSGAMAASTTATGRR